MQSPRTHGLRLGLILATTAVASTAFVDVAAAQQGTSCRGSADRSVQNGVTTAEPVVANRLTDPCVTAVAQATSSVSPLGLTAQNPRANTSRTAGLNAASASVESVAGTGASIPVTAGAIQSQQSVGCTNGTSVPSGSSTVDNLTIGGAPVALVRGSTQDINTLAGVRVRTNQFNPATGTRTALILDFPGGNQQIYGEAIAGGNACLALPSGGGTGGGGGGNTGGGNTGGGNGNLGQVCPSGSILDVARTVCVIREASATGGFVVIGRPFEGPQGGSVLSLAQARRLAARGQLPKSPCLRGPGVNYVTLGTKGNNRITGTNKRDRILGLGGRDRLDGGRNGDCLDGGNSRDVLSGAQGTDRLYGGTGNDALTGGSSTDLLSGGTGNDTINTGFGRDTVNAGPGRDAINAATAGPASRRIDCGSGRDTLRANRNERRKLRGCERRSFVR